MSTQRILAVAASTAMALASCAALATPAAAADRDWDRHRDTFRDTVRIVGNLDTGSTGGYWAALDYRRTVKITPVKTRKSRHHHDGRNKTVKYNVTLTDSGTFRTIKGKKSPGAGVEITRPSSGRFNGEMTFTVESTSKPSDRRVRSVYNYRCNVNGTGNRNTDCPGMPTGTSNWMSLYFKDAKVTETGWEWTYTGDCRERWVNGKNGNRGDITNGCPVPVTPRGVTVKQPTCTTKGTITAPDIKGLAYKTNTNVALVPKQATELAPGRYIVSATAEDGYKIRHRAQSRWFVELRTPRHCPKPTQTPIPTPSVTQSPVSDSAS